MGKIKLILLRIAYVFSCFSLLSMVMGFFTIFTQETPDKTSAIVGALMAIVVFALLCFYLKKKLASSKYDQIDDQILQMAMSHKGFITVAELASNTPLSIKQAKEHLERNYKAGYCEKKYTQENLVEVYHFKGAVSVNDMVNAKRITEIDV